MSNGISFLPSHYQVLPEILEDIEISPFQANRRYVVSIYALNFAIIYRIQDVVEFITRYYQGNKVLNQTATTRQLTPLHVAVMSSNEEAVRLLIEAKVSVNAQDKSKWTPLHHAALQGNRVAIKLLLDAGANPTLLTLTNGTYLDILSLAHPPSVDLENPIPLYWKDENGAEQQLTYGKFKDLTGADYLTENRLTPAQIIDEWRRAPTSKYADQISKEVSAKYASFVNNPSPHLMKQVQTDSEGLPLKMSPGLGLFARRDYKAGEIVGDLIGQWEDDAVSSRYIIQRGISDGYIDGQNSRNEISQVNDSFMNVVYVVGCNLNGLTERNLFVAAEPIKAGDQFFWSYGSSDAFKLYSPHIEFRNKEMREFIKAYPLQHLVECRNAFFRRKATFDQYVKTSKLSYILDTPSSILSMLFDQTITFEVGKQLMKLSLERVEDKESLTTQLLPTIPSIAMECLAVKNKIKVVSIRNKYAALVQSFPETIGLMYTLGALPELNKHTLKLIESYAQNILDKETLKIKWDELESQFVEEGKKLKKPFDQPIRPRSYEMID